MEDDLCWETFDGAAKRQFQKNWHFSLMSGWTEILLILHKEAWEGRGAQWDNINVHSTLIERTHKNGQTYEQNNH